MREDSRGCGREATRHGIEEYQLKVGKEAGEGRKESGLTRKARKVSSGTTIGAIKAMVPPTVGIQREPESDAV